MSQKTAYLIQNIEEYGKLIAYCIERDIVVWRSYWDEREKGKRIYEVDFKEKRLYYSDISFYEREGYEIVTPKFYFDKYGSCCIEKDNTK